MPDDVDPSVDDSENNTPDAPPTRAGPLKDRERMDTGCLMLMMVGFVGIFMVPAFFLLGGAPVIIPLIVFFLTALLTPFINPTERMSSRARWTGRVVTFVVLGILIGIAAYHIFLREAPILRE